MENRRYQLIPSYISQEDMLEMTERIWNRKTKIITGDETWVNGYDPETKRQSAEWRGQGDPRPKNPGY
ncbi:hypothetical protein LAZ67_7000520 [Cordylochernes scorpioides]|uniref:Uncharacterized protein n=1 Tax=Cordylochernes scorpioides TaxID=51811 RepID=A0ABY6KPQ4_9ARAC|nr:hypothetical protein LAZ67_7000520 [Cordylochernes scorpioides]